MLSELGAVGFILLGVFIAFTLTVCTLTARGVRDRWQRGLAAAFLAAILTYLTHTAYDWDWNIMAVTAPYFLFTGLLIGWYGDSRKKKDSSIEG